MLRDLDDIKITLLDIKSDMCNAWKEELNNYNDLQDESYFPNVEVVNMGIAEWLEQNNNHVLGIVSPANSFGLMDGGYDGAITKYFEEYYDFNLITIVQKHLKDNFWGEQPVGSCIMIKIPVMNTYILHTPTMIRPSIIQDPRIVYHCTRSCILEAMRREIPHIVIPAFGGKCGQVNYKTIAQYMIAAIETFSHIPEEFTWHKVYHAHILNDLELM